MYQAHEQAEAGEERNGKEETGGKEGEEEWLKDHAADGEAGRLRRLLHRRLKRLRKSRPRLNLNLNPNRHRNGKPAPPVWIISAI